VYRHEEVQNEQAQAPESVTV